MRTSFFLLSIVAVTAFAQDADNGKRLFTRNGCYQCHGGVGQGGMAGPRLAQTKLPLAVFTSILRNPPPSSMPPFREKTVSAKEVDDLYAYIKSFPPPKAVKDIPLLQQE